LDFDSASSLKQQYAGRHLLHLSDILSWFQVNKSFLLLLKFTYIAGIQQIPILLSLVCTDDILYLVASLILFSKYFRNTCSDKSYDLTIPNSQHPQKKDFTPQYIVFIKEDLIVLYYIDCMMLYMLLYYCTLFCIDVFCSWEKKKKIKKKKKR
jgi:hypothetical protein